MPIKVPTIDPNKSKQGKLKPALLHPQFFTSLSLVSEVSQLKGYELLNWVRMDVKCFLMSYLLSAILRHSTAIMEGEIYNQEYYPEGHEKAGAPVELRATHFAHIAYGALMADALIKMGRKDLDDRILKKEDF